MSVYTKNGDEGKTKVFDEKTGELISISKNTKLIHTIGVIDEVNSWLGIVNAKLQSYGEIKLRSKNEVERKVQKIQGDLFTINAILAGADIKKTCLPAGRAKELEKEIDEMEGELPVQKNFIYYGGSEISSMLFFARSLVRRAERSLVSLSKGSNILLLTSDILPYVNRLSDYLFILARFINFKSGVGEEFWIIKKRH
jgi:cob(I)alamin adenosyltransferase